MDCVLTHGARTAQADRGVFRAGERATERLVQEERSAVAARGKYARRHKCIHINRLGHRRREERARTCASCSWLREASGTLRSTFLGHALHAQEWKHNIRQPFNQISNICLVANDRNLPRLACSMAAACCSIAVFKITDKRSNQVTTEKWIE